ncbi:xanthine dehydrogenase family protein molybdopterin-binding subunit [Defluviimonas sp. SAOS-178_SWC]|uniref:xanthine dehydrogenase family protein molybdopterin-binding subunit n=1 Tax=Defluviimonas sp. SAOS-178_SWC TaxID=3121287 RepID=UPI0032220E7C
MTKSESPKFLGVRVTRLEDPRYVSGRGRYLEDLELPGMRHVRFVRSQMAHARIESISADFALSEFPGVQVFTAANLPDLALRPRQDVCGAQHADQPVLARDVVRFVGEPVAVVVADDPYIAEDAAELVDIVYDPLPVITSREAALAPDARPMFGDWANNCYVEREMAGGDIDAARKAARHVFTRTYRTQRQVGVPMECRGVLAALDASGADLTVWSSTQMPHLLRSYLATELDWPENRLRVVAPDVGGGFGVKAQIFVEEIVVAWLATELDCPVKWVEDRREHLLASIHARDHEHTLTAYLDDYFRFVGLEADITVDSGAYPVWPWTGGGEPGMAAKVLPGPYDITAYRAKYRSVATNKCPLGTYRGVARPSAVFTLERLVDDMAHEFGLDPIEFRLRNVVREFPYRNVLGFTYDSGSYAESLERMRELLEADRAEAARTRDATTRIGVGISCYVEQTAHGTPDFTRRSVPIETGYESVRVEMEPDGKVVIQTGMQNHGQGHETTFAQVAADQLGISPGDVVLRHGDTAGSPYSVGTWGSRGAVLGGGGVHRAAGRLRGKLCRIAAHAFQTRAEDIVLINGVARAGNDPERTIPIATLARWATRQVDKLPVGMEPGLSESVTLDGPADGTYSNAVHAAVVEIDTLTGILKLRRFYSVEDCGTVINPMIVEGQARGGITQAIGSALLEEFVYDEDGQPLTTNFADYLMPMAPEIPDIHIEHLESPSPLTELGMKGMGEGGAIGAAAAIANAATDALGKPVMQTPITPNLILQMMASGETDPA